MAEIDRRVLVLTNLLAETGFGWLAGDILRGIEDGRLSNPAEGEAINQSRERLLHREQQVQIDDEIEDDSLELSSKAFEADEQIRYAVDRMREELVVSTKELDASMSNLSVITGESTGIGIFDGESIRMIEMDNAVEAMRVLSRTNDIYEWLITSEDQDES